MTDVVGNYTEDSLLRLGVSKGALARLFLLICVILTGRAGWITGKIWEKFNWRPWLKSYLKLQNNGSIA